jgi:hypothetical protein
MGAMGRNGQQGSGVAGWVAPGVGWGRRGLAAGRKASGSRIAQMVSWGVGSFGRGVREKAQGERLALDAFRGAIAVEEGC